MNGRGENPRVAIPAPEPGGGQLRKTLGFLLQDASRLMRRRFILRAREAALPLNHSETSVLQHVARDQGVTQAKLANQLDIEPITLVRLLDRLQGLGLIERRSHPSDRRSWTIWLTEAARSMLERIDVIRLSVRAEAVEGLSPAEYEALVEALVRIRANLAPKSDCRRAEAETVPETITRAIPGPS